jgi:hypothetical protein
MLDLKAFKGQDHQSHIMAHMIFGASPMVGNLPPVAMILQKHILQHIQIQAQEQAAGQLAQQMEASGQEMNPQQDMAAMDTLVSQLIAQGMQQVKELSAQISGEGQQGPDPLVQLKEQELQIKAQAEQNDAQIDAQKMQLDTQSLQMRNRQFGERLSAQERQTQARIDSAMEREILKQQGD